MAIPSGWRISQPSPVASIRGRVPSSAAMLVIRMGRKRRRAAVTMASAGASDCWCSADRAKSIIRMVFFITTPTSRNRPNREIRFSSLSNTTSAISAPTPAEGKVERIANGWMKLSYSTPSTRYTASIAPRINHNWRSRISWKLPAEPASFPCTSVGSISAAMARSIAAVASPRVTSGASANSTRVAANCWRCWIRSWAMPYW